MTAIPRCALLAPLLLLPAGVPARAQTPQVAEPALSGPVARGACGQPLAATHVLRQPLDRVPAAPFAAETRFHEPAYLEFALAAPARVALRAEAQGADPILLLLDRGGGIASDDDGGGGTDALIDMTLAPGIYCAQVRLFGGGIVPAATVSLLAGAGAEAEAIAARPPAEAEAPEPCADPALTEAVGGIAAGTGALILAGTLGDGVPRDFAFDLPAPLTLQIDARSDAFDTVLDLFDAAGARIDGNDDWEGTDSRLTLELAAGSYCARVTSYSGTGGPFELVLSDEPDAPAPGEDASFCADPALTEDFPAPLRRGVGSVVALGAVPDDGAQDWRLTVVEAMPLQIDARSGAFDTVIELRDAAGAFLDWNDDFGGSDSRIATELPAGDYCLRVSGFAGGGGPYELAVTDAVEGPPEPAPESAACADPATTAALGRSVGPGVGLFRIPGTLAPGGRQDWTMTVEGAVTVQFDAASRAFDTVLALLDADGRTVAENDDGPSGTDSRFVEALAPGDYCLSLRSYGDAGGGTFTLTLTEQDPETLRRAAIEAGEMIPDAAGGVEVEELGTLATTLRTQRLSRDRTKWVAFELAEPGLVQVQASSLIGGFVLRLYAADGARLAEAESAGLPNAASLYRELAPGRYVVGQTLAEDPAARLNLRQIVLTRFVRPS